MSQPARRSASECTPPMKPAPTTATPMRDMAPPFAGEDVYPDDVAAARAALPHRGRTFSRTSDGEPALRYTRWVAFR